ncbi:MFS transporter [Streptomyces polygonati]|uniref:MFS transporter n=1 Tax=Streptomyces polygonati TaxID=1617087 RepID=A0ABV8HRV7_9ACTN
MTSDLPGASAGPHSPSWSWTWWSRFSLVYLCGVLAATGLGKMAPVSVQMRASLGLSLDRMALVTSSITAVAALFGIPVSYLVGRLALRWALLGGCVVMAGAGFTESRVHHFGPMIATRLAEGVGYVAVVVAAPAVIIAMGDGVRRITALAVWGTFFPVGLALGLFAGGLVSSAIGWRGWLAVQAGTLIVVGAAAVAALGSPGLEDAAAPVAAPEAAGPAGARWPTLRRPVLLALGFATASGTIVAVVTLLPTYLHESLGASTATAGTLTGVVSLTGTAGGFLSGWLLRRGVPARQVFAASLLMPLGTALAFLHSGGIVLSAVGGLLVALANELVVAAAFATIPTVVSTPADIGLANGLLAQIGSLGSLAGPPLVSLALLVADGWWAVAPTVLVVCAAGTVLLRASVRRPAV